MKRVFDILFSLVSLILLSPFFIVISILIKLDSRGKIFFTQKRVGKDFKEFFLYKFRTMKEGSEKAGMLTIGEKDSRVTRMGFYLRKYKLDELPQLVNVLRGDMSMVGPRPEVKKYVDLYSEEQKEILSVRPGITDVASLQFSNESEVLAKYANPEEAYVKEIMPAKLSLSLNYIKKSNQVTDAGVIMKTAGKIFSHSSIEIFLLAALVFMLPLHERAAAWPAAAVIILRLFDKNVFFDAKLSAKNIFSFLCIAYFLAHLAGTFYSGNLSYAFFDLQIKLPFLLFPLLLMAPLNKPSAFNTLKNFFITGCTVAAVLCLVAAIIDYLTIHNPSKFFYSPYSMFLHVTYFSMYLNLCILFLIDDLVREKSKHRAFRILLLVFLFLTIILLSARTALFTAFITGVLYAVIIGAHRKILKRAYKAILLLGIILAAAALYSNIIYNRFVELVDVFKEVQAEKKIERPQTEEGYNSVSIRVELWQDSWELIKDHILFGVGTGDVKDALEKKYTEHKFYYGAEKKFNPHNQFLHTGVTLGLMGVIILLLIMMVPGFQSLKTKNYLFVFFMAIIFLNCITESILEVQKGVFFFCVFGILIFNPGSEHAPDKKPLPDTGGERT